MRKKIIIALSIITLICTSCNKSNEVEPVTKEEESINYKDVSNILKSVTIGDKVVGFPFVLKDLPEEFNVELSNDESCRLKKGKKYLEVSLNGDFSNAEDFINTGIVDGIDIIKADVVTEFIETDYSLVTIGGIGIDSTLDEVVEKFGVPSEIVDVSEMYDNRKDDEQAELRYFGKDGYSVIFSATDGVNINCIFIYREELK